MYMYSLFESLVHLPRFKHVARTCNRLARGNGLSTATPREGTCPLLRRLAPFCGSPTTENANRTPSRSTHGRTSHGCSSRARRLAFAPPSKARRCQLGLTCRQHPSAASPCARRTASPMPSSTYTSASMNFSSSPTLHRRASPSAASGWAARLRLRRVCPTADRLRPS